MTDNDIIKALECCFIETNCANCPLHINKPYDEDCLKITAAQALCLIKRQKAEIECMKQLIEAAIAGQETLQKLYREQSTDVVEVVRCKDCIYNERGICRRSEYYDDLIYSEDFYCADGERKTSDGSERH